MDLRFAFGKARSLAAFGCWNYILGGWSGSMIHRYESGAPISVSATNFDGQALFNPNLRADVLLGPDQQKLTDSVDNPDRSTGTPYLNPAAFANPPLTSRRVPIHLGNAPRYLPNVRGFSRFGEDFSLIKKTDLHFREGMNFEIRIDALNIFNRIGIGGPVTDVNDANFGRVFNKAGSPRTMQIGGRLTF